MISCILRRVWTLTQPNHPTNPPSPLLPEHISSLRCLLGDGLRGEGLGITSPLFLGATPLAVEARVVLASAVFFLVHIVVSDMEWDWLLQVARWRTWCVGVQSSLWSPLLPRGERSRCTSYSGYGRPCDYTA